MIIKPGPKCKKCALYKDCTYVPGAGPKAKLAIIGEAPGREEELAGIPLVGRPGRLLNFIINKLGISRDEIYITNAVKCKPANGKLPTKKKEREDVLRRCKPILFDELKRKGVQTILCLGATAMEQISGKSNISRFEGREVMPSVFVGYHPSYILRNHWDERKLTVAVYRAAKHAEMKVKVQTDGKLFDYNAFQ